MAVISGIGGAVNGIPCVRSWEASVSEDVQEAVSSCSDGAVQRITGNEDWSGTFTQFATDPVSMPGNLITFAGSIEGTVGVTGPAIVDQVDVNVDIEGGTPIELETSFSSDGAVTVGASVGVDSSVAVPEGSKLRKIEVAINIDTPVYVAIPDVTSFNLSLVSTNTSYVSSTTAGATRRIPGNKDTTGSFAQLTGDFASMLQPGDIVLLRLFVTATEFWQLTYVRIIDLSNLQVDREGATPVGGTVNFAFSGIEVVSASPTKGTIIQPDTTVWWP